MDIQTADIRLRLAFAVCRQDLVELLVDIFRGSVIDHGIPEAYYEKCVVLTQRIVDAVQISLVRQIFGLVRGSAQQRIKNIGRLDGIDHDIVKCAAVGKRFQPVLFFIKLRPTVIHDGKKHEREHDGNDNDGNKAKKKPGPQAHILFGFRLVLFFAAHE